MGGKIRGQTRTFQHHKKRTQNSPGFKIDPPEHGRNPDQGLQVHKVFLTVRANHIPDLRLLFAHGMKPHKLVSWGV